MRCGWACRGSSSSRQDRSAASPRCAPSPDPSPTCGFLPSGGVTAENAGEYLASPSVFAVSGSWMATRDLIAAGDFEAIERLSRACVELEPS